MFLYIYTLLIGISLSHASLSKVEGRAISLLNAKSLNELKISTSHHELLETLQSRCEFEIKAKSIPASCYEYAKLTQKTQQISKLDELCEESKITKKIDKMPIYLSERCKKIVESRNQELDYIEKEQNPYGYVNSQ